MRIALMVTCLDDVFFPDTGSNDVRVLRRLGVEVDYPAGHGVLWPADGELRHVPEAEPLVRNLVDAFNGYDHVVAPIGSCTGFVPSTGTATFGSVPPAPMVEAHTGNDPRTPS